MNLKGKYQVWEKEKEGKEREREGVSPFFLSLRGEGWLSGAPDLRSLPLGCCWLLLLSHCQPRWMEEGVEEKERELFTLLLGEGKERKKKTHTHSLPLTFYKSKKHWS